MQPADNQSAIIAVAVHSRWYAADVDVSHMEELQRTVVPATLALMNATISLLPQSSVAGCAVALLALMPLVLSSQAMACVQC